MVKTSEHSEKTDKKIRIYSSNVYQESGKVRTLPIGDKNIQIKFTVLLSDGWKAFVIDDENEKIALIDNNSKTIVCNEGELEINYLTDEVDSFTISDFEDPVQTTQGFRIISLPSPDCAAPGTDFRSRYCKIIKGADRKTTEDQILILRAKIDSIIPTASKEFVYTGTDSGHGKSYSRPNSNPTMKDYPREEERIKKESYNAAEKQKPHLDISDLQNKLKQIVYVFETDILEKRISHFDTEKQAELLQTRNVVREFFAKWQILERINNLIKYRNLCETLKDKDEPAKYEGLNALLTQFEYFHTRVINEIFKIISLLRESIGSEELDQILNKRYKMLGNESRAREIPLYEKIDDLSGLEEAFRELKIPEKEKYSGNLDMMMPMASTLSPNENTDNSSLLKQPHLIFDKNHGFLVDFMEKNFNIRGIRLKEDSYILIMLDDLLSKILYKINFSNEDPRNWIVRNLGSTELTEARKNKSEKEFAQEASILINSCSYLDDYNKLLDHIKELEDHQNKDQTILTQTSKSAQTLIIQKELKEKTKKNIELYQSKIYKRKEEITKARELRKEYESRIREQIMIRLTNALFDCEEGEAKPELKPELGKDLSNLINSGKSLEQNLKLDVNIEE